MSEVFKSFVDLAVRLKNPERNTQIAVAIQQAEQRPAEAASAPPADLRQIATVAPLPTDIRWKELEARERAVVLQENRLSEREISLRLAEDALRERVVRLGDLKLKLERMQAERSRLEGEFRALRADGFPVEKEIQHRREEPERALPSRLKEAHSELASLTAKRDSLERECGSIIDSKRAVEAMRNLVVRREAELEAEDRALTDWRSELVEFQKELVRLEKSLRPRDDRLKEREKKVAAAEQRHAKTRAELRETKTALEECDELRTKAERKAATAVRAAEKARELQEESAKPKWSAARDNMRESLIFSSDGMAAESPINRLGYAVGITGLPQSKRRQILEAAWEGGLPRVHTSAYMAEWGKPLTRRRLARIAHHLAWLIRFNGAKRTMSEAVADWTADLSWLKRTYYQPAMNFPWPKP